MENSNRNSKYSAFPLPLGSETVRGSEGLSKREWMATMVMQKLSVGNLTQVEIEKIAKDSIKLADELLKQLEG